MKFVTHAASLLLITSTLAYAEVPVFDKSDSFIETPHAQQAYVEAKDNESARESSTELIHRMQKEIQDLRGQLEVQAHDLKMMQQQQEGYYKDLDARIGNHAAAAPATATLTPTPAPAAAAPQVTVPLPPPPSSHSMTTGEKEAFLQASEYVTLKKYSLAQESLTQFLQKYPDSQNAPEAHYWLGELFLVSGDHQSAVREFDTITKKFPDSKKCAQALLKLGFVYFDQGELVKARESLEEVKKRFPNSTSATLAENRLQAIEDVLK